MKKLLLSAALVLLCASGYAQLVQTSSLIVTKKALEPVKRGYQSDIRLGVYCLGFQTRRPSKRRMPAVTASATRCLSERVSA